MAGLGLINSCQKSLDHPSTSLLGSMKIFPLVASSHSKSHTVVVIGLVKNCVCGSSHCGAGATNPTSNHEVSGLIPGLAQWVKDLVLPRAVCGGVGHRHGSAPALLWLWCRPAAAALI